MPIVFDGTTGLTTPGITLGSTAVTASANQINSSAEDVNSENRIINGDFRVWQRGATFNTNVYGADRWRNEAVGGTATMSVQSFALGDTLGTTQPFNFLRHSVTGTTLPGHYGLFCQFIEGVRSYAGQTITVLGWARRSSGATGDMALEATQNFGTGGSPTPSITGLSATIIPLTGAWEPFAVVMNIPTVSGKTLGTLNSMDQLGLYFWTSAGSNFAVRTANLGLQTIGVDIWGVHIRQGTWTAADAALYRPRDPGTELVLCQRYYEKSYDIATAPGTNTGVAASIEDMSMPTTSPLRVRFAVSKRAVPAMTVYDAAGTINRVTAWLPAQTNGQSLSALDNFGNSGFKAFLTAAGLTRLAFHWTADAEL